MQQDELFSEPWARALGEALRQSDAYRRAAAFWKGAVVVDLAAAGIWDPAAIDFSRDAEDWQRLAPLETFTDFATSQFQRRMKRIEKANGQTLEQICRAAIGAVHDES